MTTEVNAFATATASLAGRALAAFDSGEGSPFAAAGAEPEVSDLAAARLLGPDLCAVALLRGRPLNAADAALVTQAQEAFAPPRAGPEDGGEVWAAAWTHAAVESLLPSATGRTPASGAGASGPTHASGPPSPSYLSAPGPGPGPGPLARIPSTDWKAWSWQAAQVASLAVPGLRGPVQEAVLSDPVPLARGAVRAILRGDFRLAGRLARWLALCHSRAMTMPLEVPPMLAQLRLLGCADPRTALDVALAVRVAESDS